jgi:large subunit ribosomal protein L30
MATLRVTCVVSTIGHNQRHKDTVRSLGLRRLHQTVELPDRPEVRGMIGKVSHFLAVEESADGATDEEG